MGWGPNWSFVELEEQLAREGEEKRKEAEKQSGEAKD